MPERQKVLVTHHASLEHGKEAMRDATAGVADSPRGAIQARAVATLPAANEPNVDSKTNS